ncbi:hypothetical protein PR003_g13882 [Phytophthora rubi]|uniref:Uncharacterized protein n=1 Tax=Phytophthora rubi TaxID=129364 RepID=A0A6A3L1E7_9STRA|nr:hypothetical protein PR002_g14998 [Phytophthora rubi]KAE9022603.1 hypothetical protein PR001_g13115 [Phytophthora rubi]KAE9333711.1 hypothetical protein PR003_g13882 [Phytophthora rubi]
MIYANAGEELVNESTSAAFAMAAQGEAIRSGDSEAEAA